MEGLSAIDSELVLIFAQYLSHIFRRRMSEWNRTTQGDILEILMQLIFVGSSLPGSLRRQKSGLAGMPLRKNVFCFPSTQGLLAVPLRFQVLD